MHLTALGVSYNSRFWSSQFNKNLRPSHNEADLWSLWHWINTVTRGLGCKISTMRGLGAIWSGWDMKERLESRRNRPIVASWEGRGHRPLKILRRRSILTNVRLEHLHALDTKRAVTISRSMITTHRRSVNGPSRRTVLHPSRTMICRASATGVTMHLRHE